MTSPPRFPRPLLILATVTIAITAGCSTPAPTAPAPPAASATSAAPTVEPRTVDAVKVAAQRRLDLYAAGDWAGTWDLWTAAGKAAITRADYIRLHTECKTLTGILFEITNVRLDTDSTAVVAWKRSILAGTSTMKYEDGAWQFQPDAEAMAGYAKGVDKLIAEKKADDDCG